MNIPSLAARVSICLVGATAISLALAGCSPSVALQPAADAANPACAAVIVRLPDTVAGLSKRETDAQATGAWGSPTSVILRCGVPVPAPTASLPCITVKGIDWLRDGAKDPSFVFTSYGRDPAVEVILDGTKASGLSTLNDLAYAVGKIPASHRCTATTGITQ